jgi:hypothetical protein
MSISMIEIEIDFKNLAMERALLVSLQDILIDSCKQEVEIEIDKELAWPFQWTLFDYA